MRPKEDDDVRRSLQRENDCAVRVAAEGYQVQQNPTRPEVTAAREATGDTGNLKKTPDYLVEGHVFDCYAPSPSKSLRGVWDEVGQKVKKRQTQRVVLHLGDWRGDPQALKKQFDDWPVPNLKELVAVKRDGGIIQIVDGTEKGG
ncbi:hypothetical protein [Micromonospora sp. SH-82]|uniref:CdiA C-terminal domain-containing protein n=1 Tax=Micromonospora sp. SH-82 TaxID=3132938 RepID=UPI003EB7186E